MKSGDILVAVASLAVVYILVYSMLSIALVPMNSFWGLNASFLLAVLVSALAVGYVFARKIREESRVVMIGKIAVLFAFVIMFIGMLGSGAGGHYGALVDENLQNMYETSSWTNTDWVAHETMVVALSASVNVVGVLALGFAGLYLGSMLKPSTTTKE